MESLVAPAFVSKPGAEAVRASGEPEEPLRLRFGKKRPRQETDGQFLRW